jgi:hypothetical protein
VKVVTNVCDHPKCRRKAVAAYDVRRNGFMVGAEGAQHYEVCEKHDRELFPRGEGFLTAEQSELIRRELVPS